MDAKFHKQYLQWKKDIKNGKKAYYISNVAVTSLIATAAFSIILGILNIVMKLNLPIFKIVLFTILFLIVYGGASFLIYFISWNKSMKKFAIYENQLNEKLIQKIENGEIEDHDGLLEKLKAAGSGYDQLHQPRE